MSVTLQQAWNMGIAGISFSSSRQRSGATPQATSVSERDANLTMAKIAQLTTRTDNTSGVITGTTGHGIATGNKVDLYWDGGIRYGVTVGTVSTNAIPFSLGWGDNLPTNNTVVNICKVTVIDDAWGDVNGDVIAVLLALMPVRGHAVFQEADGTDIVATELIANEAYEFWESSLTANPFAGVAVGKIIVSSGEPTSAGGAYFNLGVLYG